MESGIKISEGNLHLKQALYEKRACACMPKRRPFSGSPEITKELQPVYRPQDRTTRLLFPELFPFGGKLDERNRWLRIADLIPWQDLEDEYRKAFS